MPAPLSRSHVFALLVLVLSTVVLYYPGLAGPFIFDDGPALTGNPYLRIDGTAFDDWRTASMSSNSGPLHRPVAMWSFTANIVAAGGVESFPLKATNLAIHLACGLLVFLFARGVLRVGTRHWDPGLCDWVALLAASLWLLAPLHVSTVLYAVQRMAQLATLFSLAGLVLFIALRERWARQGATPGELLAAGLWLSLCTLLAVLSKENGALLPWLLAVVEVTLFRGRWAGRERRWLRWLGGIACVAPLLLTAAVLLWSPDTLLGGYARREFTVEERLLTQLRLLWQYLAWMVFPNIDAMGFQHDDLVLSTGWLQPVSTAIAGIAWVAAIVAAIALRRRQPLLLFALLFYLFGHFMESGIWPLEMVYEHRSYLPDIGVFIALAAALTGIFRRVRTVRIWVPVLAVLAISGTVLFLRVFSWSEPLRLSAINVANHPDSSRSHYFLAETWLREYRAALRAGAPPEELSKLLVLARNEFELMYLLNPRDIAAIVMLYYLDQHHFQELQAYNDWFSVLEEVARDRPLQASDYTALEALLDCFVADVCTAPRERLLGLFDTLELRYPGSNRLRLLRYRYLKSLGAPLEERMALLHAMQEARPGSDRVYQYLLVEQGESRDVAGLYETLRAWMEHDPQRRQLGVIRRMFDTPPSETPGTTAAGRGDGV